MANRNEPLYQLTARQFWTGLVLTLTVLGVTPFAMTNWVINKVIESQVQSAITQHNSANDAHSISLAATAERLSDRKAAADARILEKLDDLSKRLSNIEGKLLGHDTPQMRK